MKKLTSIIILSLSVLLNLGYGNVVQKSELNFRNGTYYPINSDKPYSGKIVSYYENGQLKSSTGLKNGELDGLCENYYENGQLESSSTYKDGKLDGLMELFKINGKLNLLINFKEGKEDGEYKSYYENGQLQQSVRYKNGEYHGLKVGYYENGQLSSLESYKNGEQDGLFESYYENGQLESSGNYEKGGKLKFSLDYKNGQIVSKNLREQRTKIDILESKIEKLNTSINIFLIIFSVLIICGLLFLIFFLIKKRKITK